MAPLDVRLPKTGDADDQIDTVVQPDIFIVSDPRKIDARGVRGAPDWIAEVLSPSTARYDQTVKLAAYEQFNALITASSLDRCGSRQMSLSTARISRTWGRYESKSAI